jgi:hypothetical protein
MSPAPTAEARPSLGVGVANAVATGLFLGTLQWSVFFLLQSYLASTAVVYLLATSVWLAGSLAGMVAPGAREPLWLVGAVGAFYVFRFLATAHPYALGWLPPLLLLVAAMGAYAGRFFRCRAGLFPSAKWLFFLENTGFVAGMMTTAVALYWAGETWFTVAPLCAFGLVAATGRPFLLAQR